MSVTRWFFFWSYAGTGAHAFTSSQTAALTFSTSLHAEYLRGTPEPYQVHLEMEFEGRGQGWTEVRDWRLAEGLVWERGLPGSGVADCIADSGSLSFVLNNSITNSAHLLGYYSPDHANCRTGFKLMIGVRVRLTISTTSYIRFTGYLDFISPEPGTNRGYGVQCEAIGWMGLCGRTRLSDLPILLNATGEDVFQTIIDGLPDFSKPRALEKDHSADVYPYILDRIRDEQTSARDELYRLALSGLDRVWERGDGTLVYESRSRRQLTKTNVDTFTNTHGFAAPRSAEYVANAAQATVHPRLLGTVTDAVMFTLNQPMALAVGQTVEILGPWTDVDNPDVRVGAVSLVSLATGIDYVANELADGTGTDLTANLTVAVGLSGNATKYTVTLGGSTPGFLTVLQQRGQPLLDYGAIPAQQIDQTSINAYGLNPLNIDLPYQADPNFGIEVSQYIVFTRAFPMTMVEGFRRVVGLTNQTEMARSFGREISDRIGVVDTVTGIARSFFIDHIRETIFHTHVETEFSLSIPVDLRTFWEVEVPARSELDVTTRLNFGLILGHTDAAHWDVHGDTAHADVAHADTHTDNVHQDQLHGDGPSHGDSVHADSHSDAVHADAAHSDAHIDDPFVDQKHVDQVINTPHVDEHTDEFTNFNNAARDVAIYMHGDEHANIAHGDQEIKTPHIDEAHEDLHFDVAHADTPHGDVVHSDIAHNDASAHSDVGHADAAHGDVAHSDVLHSDAIHADMHGDTVHGDAN